MLSRLGALADRLPWPTLVVALLFSVAAGIFGTPVAGLLKGGGFADPGADSQRAADRLQAATGQLADGLIVLVRPREPVDSPAGRQEIEEIGRKLAADPDVASVIGYANTGSPAFISRDGRETYLVAKLRSSVPDDGVAAERISGGFTGDARVRFGGVPLAQAQVQDQVRHDLATAEELAFPVLFVLALWVFRGAVAALLPLLVGGITILGAFLGLRIATGLVPLSIFALNLITGMGLGLAIDYSLFMVSRYREELAAGHSVGAALRRTMSTSGRTILFSSLTVAAAMASLLVFPERFLYSMGIGGVITSLTACAVALLVLPAVLRLLGHRVNALAPRRWQQPLEAEAGFWAALARRVMARPVLAAAASGALLLSLGLPFLGVKFTSVDTNVLPAKYSSRQVAEALDSDFSQNPAPSLYAVFEGGAVTGQEVKAFADRVQGLGEVKSVSVRQAGATAWEVDVQARHGVYSDQVRELVSSIRGLGADHPYLVGGRAATFVDLQSSLLDHLPLALGIVACATIVILFLMTGSVLLPLKSVLMNIVTLSAAMGILVLVFQDGNLTGLLRFTRQGALESTQPVLLFAIVFGLSTDYGVFLLSRIKELRDSGLSNRESVVRGLGRTGRIVSAAALLFCVAIGAFATSEIVFIKELGVGTAIGVLLDATIVRGLLVPALMRLLGGWNWWAPSPLRWLHERLGLRESSAPAAT